MEVQRSRLPVRSTGGEQKKASLESASRMKCFDEPTFNFLLWKAGTLAFGI